MSRPPRDPRPAVSFAEGTAIRSCPTAASRIAASESSRERSPRLVERRAATLPRKSSGAGATKRRTKVALVPASHGAAASLALRRRPVRALPSPRAAPRPRRVRADRAHRARGAARAGRRRRARHRRRRGAAARARAARRSWSRPTRVVEGVHFRFGARDAPRAVGAARSPRRSPTSPRWARGRSAFTCALAAPPATRRSRRARRLAARRSCDGARRYACPLVGGNLTRARETSLTIDGVRRRSRAAARCGAPRARGRPHPRHRGARRAPRSRARAPSAAARRCAGPGAAARGRARRSPGIARRRRLHRRLGRARRGPRARARRVAASARDSTPTRLPLPRGFAAACRRLGLDPRALALAGGEDYELLFTLAAGRPVRGGARAPARRPRDARSAGSTRGAAARRGAGVRGLRRTSERDRLAHLTP